MAAGIAVVVFSIADDDEHIYDVRYFRQWKLYRHVFQIFEPRGPDTEVFTALSRTTAHSSAKSWHSFEQYSWYAASQPPKGSPPQYHRRQQQHGWMGNQPRYRRHRYRNFILASSFR